MHALGGVAFAEFLEQDWFLTCSIIVSVWSEECVDGAEEVPHHLSSLVWPSLHFTNEIIEV